MCSENNRKKHFGKYIPYFALRIWKPQNFGDWYSPANWNYSQKFNFDETWFVLSFTKTRLTWIISDLQYVYCFFDKCIRDIVSYSYLFSVCRLGNYKKFHFSRDSHICRDLVIDCWPCHQLLCSYLCCFDNGKIVLLSQFHPLS